MAEPVDLRPGPYRGTYKLVGGSPALDFANLVSYRGTDREHDWLDPASNAVRWAEVSGLPAPTAAERAGLTEFRELLAAVFLAVADGATPDAADVDRIGSLAADAHSRRRLRFPAGASAGRWVDASPTLVGELALDAADLLTSPERLSRVAACRECRWVFLDTTRNHSRAWCDPADCGNRTRQRRHYHRSPGS